MIDDAPTGTLAPGPAVTAVTGEPVAAAEPLTHNDGNAGTGGIWRVRGPVGSAICKVAVPPRTGWISGAPAAAGWPTSDQPTHWNYWRREAMAYKTGLAACAYAELDIMAPALLESQERPDGGVELWLADAGGAPGFAWPVARLARFAWQLGAAQALWIGQVPAEQWLSRRWLAQYLAQGPSRRVWITGDEHWRHPAVEAWPLAVREQLRRLWSERERLVALAEAAPRTLCHLDVWPANLVADDTATVLLDWSCAGEGGLGEDAANLIVDSVADGLLDAALLPEVTAGVTDGYLTGLRDGGWTGSADTVRHAIAVCGAAKYSWFAPAVLGRVIEGGSFSSRYGRDATPEATLHRLQGLATLLADWSRTATG